MSKPMNNNQSYWVFISNSHLKHFIQSIVFLVVQNIVKGSLWSWHWRNSFKTDCFHQNHLPMQFLGFLAHVDDVVLAKHLWGVGLVPTRSAQRLAWNIQPLDAAGAFRKDSANTSEEDWQKGKWLKVSDAVHSISLPRLVAKLMPFFLIARKWWELLFPPFLAGCCMGNEDAKHFKLLSTNYKKAIKVWRSGGAQENCFVDPLLKPFSPNDVE